MHIPGCLPCHKYRTQQLRHVCQHVTWCQGTLQQYILAEAATHPSLLHAGYAFLGPYARQQGWAPGPIGDWRTGATGWVLWVSLAIMLGDSITSLSLLLLTSLQRHVHAMRYSLLQPLCCKMVKASKEIVKRGLDLLVRRKFVIHGFLSRPVCLR